MTVPRKGHDVPPLTFLPAHRIHPLWRFDTGLRATLNKPLKGKRMQMPPDPLVSGFFFGPEARHDRRLENTHKACA